MKSVWCKGSQEACETDTLDSDAVFKLKDMYRLIGQSGCDPLCVFVGQIVAGPIKRWVSSAQKSGVTCSRVREVATVHVSAERLSATARNNIDSQEP